MLIGDNLCSRYFLADKNTNEAVYFGRRFKPYVPQGYMSGGAGYVLSKTALQKFVAKGVDDPKFCRVDAGGAEDLEFGKCMQRVGVTAGEGSLRLTLKVKGCRHQSEIAQEVQILIMENEK